MGQDPADDGPPAEEPSRQRPAGGEPHGQPEYRQPQYGQPQYGQPQYGQSEYPPPPGYGVPPAYSPPGNNPPPPGSMPPYPASGYGPPPADKPGVIPLRPLAVGELLDGAFTTMRLNPRAMLGLSFVVVLIGQLVVLALNLAVHDASSGARLAVSLASIVVTQLVASISTGAAIIVVGEAVLGDRISPADVLARLRGRVWRLVGLGLLVSLLWVLAAVVLIIPGIYVFVLLSLATPVFVLEKTNVRAALRRSANLVRGSWWRTFGILLLAALVAALIGALVGIPFTIFAANSSRFLDTTNADVSTGGQILLAIGRLVGGTLTTPIIAGTIALMYIDRRMRREGLDIVLAQAARERQGRS